LLTNETPVANPRSLSVRHFPGHSAGDQIDIASCQAQVFTSTGVKKKNHIKPIHSRGRIGAQKKHSHPESFIFFVAIGTSDGISGNARRGFPLF
jgi:hypothetical protein